MCPQPVCECPSRKTAAAGLIGRALLGALKLAIAGALVYATVEAGIWGKPEQSELLFANVYRLFSPQACGKKRKEGSAKSDKDLIEYSESCEAQQELMIVVSSFLV